MCLFWFNYIMEINPYVRFAMDDIITKSWYLNRCIFDYELIFIKKGVMNITIKNKKYTAKQGDIVFFTPGRNHYLTKGSEILQQPHVHFDFFEDELSSKIMVNMKLLNKVSDVEKTYFRSDNLEKIGFNLPVVIRLENTSVIEQLLYQIIKEYNYQLSESKLYLKALMTELIINIIREYNTKKLGTKVDATDFDNLNRYIVNNIEKQITLEELAEYSNLSKFYFIKIFKEHFGMPPLQYVKLQKGKKAKEYLLHTNLSIGEISDKLSFDSQQSFCKWFRTMYGVSPNQFKKQ